MRLLLIRHGETVDNVAGNYAGITDSALTNHGVLQAGRLGLHLATTGVKTACIFSSDLQRAFKTADAIRVAQPTDAGAVIQLPVLREQDFGFYEGKRFYERSKDSNKGGKDAHLAVHRNEPGFVDVESKEAMTKRAEAFVDQHLLDLLIDTTNDDTVVVVAHGIILNHLWRAVLRRFHPGKVTMVSGVGGADRGLEYLGGWSNTGYLDLEIKSPSATEIDPPATPERSNAADATDADRASAVAEAPLLPDTALVPLTAAAQFASPTNVPAQPTAKLLEKLLVIKAVNSLDHLKGLKKTGGGIGSLKHDSSQKTMDSFFKKRKTE